MKLLDLQHSTTCTIHKPFLKQCKYTFTFVTKDTVQFNPLWVRPWPQIFKHKEIRGLFIWSVLHFSNILIKKQKNKKISSKCVHVSGVCVWKRECVHSVSPHACVTYIQFVQKYICYLHLQMCRSVQVCVCVREKDKEKRTYMNVYLQCCICKCTFAFYLKHIHTLL